MALIIDERIAGGRPQKLASPSVASFGMATSRVIDTVRMARTGLRPPVRARRILTGASA